MAWVRDWPRTDVANVRDVAEDVEVGVGLGLCEAKREQEIVDITIP